MRYSRTRESETKFLDALNKVYSSKKSTFTTHLLHSVDSFLPSKIDPFLKQKMIPEIEMFRDIDLTNLERCGHAAKRVVEMITALLSVKEAEHDIFTLDNTNTVEGYFSIIKKRLAPPTKTLIDLFNTVTYTEEIALAEHNPSQPRFPETLTLGLSFVIAPEVQRVMSVDGMRQFLSTLSLASDRLIHSDVHPENRLESIVFNALVDGAVIRNFSWMPKEWILSRDSPQMSHLVEHVETADEQTAVDYQMRLEPYMSIANRNVEVFRVLDEYLTALYNVAQIDKSKNVVPVNISFFNKEFGRFLTMAETNDEVAQILDEACFKLESMTSDAPIEDESSRRRSILDPSTVKMKGPRTTATSSKVDRKAAPSRTKMVDAFQTDVLGKQKSPGKRRRKHTCPVCLVDGHHAQTCHDILSPENNERSDAYFKKLRDSGRLVDFVVSLVRRQTPASPKSVVDQLLSRGFLMEHESSSVLESVGSTPCRKRK